MLNENEVLISASGNINIARLTRILVLFSGIRSQVLSFKNAGGWGGRGGGGERGNKILNTPFVS